jgi:hypothetical protein
MSEGRFYSVAPWPLIWQRYFADQEEEVGVPVHELPVAINAPVADLDRRHGGAITSLVFRVPDAVA